MSRARDRWLNEGIEVLAEQGADGVRIDRIAARLGLSKGSFHHHFKGAAGYKRDLLDHLADVQIGAFDTAVAESGVGPDTPPRDILRNLTAILDAHSLYRPTLETALRAWALTDKDAALTQARIDESRLHALRAIWHRISDDEEVVRLSALLPYVIALGASILQPPLDASDLQRLYARIMSLVPGDAPPIGDGSPQ